MEEGNGLGLGLRNSGERPNVLSPYQINKIEKIKIKERERESVCVCLSCDAINRRAARVTSPCRHALFRNPMLISRSTRLPNFFFIFNFKTHAFLVSLCFFFLILFLPSSKVNFTARNTPTRFGMSGSIFL